MAFADGLTTFYLPTSGNAGASQWGSDVRKLLDAADAGNDATTQTDHGTGGAVTRTLDPYTLKATDDTQANFGWAVTPTDMGSTAAAKRFIAAGNHVLTIRTASDQAHATEDAQYTMYVYRVQANTSRVLLGSAAGAAFSYGAAPNTYATQTVTVNLSAIEFGVDETIQYSIEQSCPGVVVVGRINTHDTGTQGGVAIRVDHPGLATIRPTSGTSAGSCTVTGAVAPVLPATGTAAGTCTVAGVFEADKETTGTAAGTCTVSGSLEADKETTGTASGAATVSGSAGLVKPTVGTVEIGAGGGETTVKPIFIFDD